MSRKPVRIAFAALLMFAAARALCAEAPPAAESEAFAYCLTCHGSAAKGNLAIRAPRLAGLDVTYIEAQLRAYRLGWRGMRDDDSAGREMQRIAVALKDDRDISRAAQWIHAAAGNAAHADTGRRAAARYAVCAGCHGANGEGDPRIGGPALAGQARWYLEAQLRAYRDGTRGAHPDDHTGAQMRALAATLSDADISALAQDLGSP